MLDASAGIELALQTPIGRQLEADLPDDATVAVPEHYFAEVATVLRRLQMNRRYPPARIQLGIDRVLQSPLQRFSIKPLLSEAWTMRNNLTVTDALYVVLAKHADCPLVTTDRRLASAPNLPVATINP